MKRLWIFCLALLVLSGCEKEKHFITDPVYRDLVEQDFKTKKKILKDTPENLFSVFEKSLTVEEEEALMFLYAYSPLIDLTMSGGDFLLDNVRLSMNVRQEMPWGKNIPEDIFRHFVLPVRGHNETVDSSRSVFYKELRGRVIHCKTMEDAALEVNHWCHEKAVYMPTNARTCAPLSMLTTTYGRCGEESIFALAALRSVGIPARQVYTPRWAHCDDNHAWIEVWVDGKWKYLGACEPEPRLDIAWFTAPVRRGVFMQARVFGKYHSNEEIVSVNPNLTSVNVTGNYTETKKVVIEVVDTEGKPVPAAKVEYKIYNYGEFYPAVTLSSDASGLSSLNVGLGDWMVWASKEGQYGFEKLDVRHMRSDKLRIILDKKEGEYYKKEYNMVPPAEKEYQALVTDAERKKNDIRFMYEDSVRNAYIATFMTEMAAAELAKELKVDPVLLSGYIKDSRGNYGEIVRFIKGVYPQQRDLAMQLLDVITAKDLQDARADVLQIHLDGAVRFQNKPLFATYNLSGYKYADLFKNYILNPRVKNELITPWRSALASFLSVKKIYSVEDLIKEMRRIKVVDSVNSIGIETPPEGVIRAMVTDTRSKELFFVAACRTMGVASRLNPVNGKPEFNQGNGWSTVEFTQEDRIPKGEVMVHYHGGEVKDPAYYTNFTLSKIEDGVARSLDLGSNAQVDMGGGALYSAIFHAPVTVESGDYVLTAGNRKSDGSVLVDMVSFRVEPGKITDVDMVIRNAAEKLEKLGVIDTKVKFTPEVTGIPQTLFLPDKGYTALALISANKEPTNHLVRDMTGMREDFDRQGIPLMFLFADKAAYEKFSRHDFRPLPNVMILGYDDDNHALARMLQKSLNLKNVDNLPLIVMFNKDGEVVFISQGYRIGLGNQIMKVMSYD